MQKLLHLASVLPSSSLKNSISQKKNIFPNPPKIAIIKKNVVYAIELWAAAAQGKTKYTDEQAPGRDNIWNFKFAPEVRRT